jgi:hypothetical protein
MATEFQLPFSARTPGKINRIADDFPQTGRIGLLHLVRELVARKYVEGWEDVIRELQRIARTTPVEYPNEPDDVYIELTEKLIAGLSWEKVFDFCERIHGYLAKDVGYYGEYDTFNLTKPRSEVQEFISSELQRLFSEEGLVFDFCDGSVQRRGGKHTAQIVSKGQAVMGDSRLVAARQHYNKALKFFRTTDPDFENTVKEAVCAVEAAGKALFPHAKATTLGDLNKWLNNDEEVRLPKAISRTIDGLYAFRSSGEGVGHGGAKGGTVSAELAEYVLSVAASQIILLVALANSNEQDVPF